MPARVGRVQSGSSGFGCAAGAAELPDRRGGQELRSDPPPEAARGHFSARAEGREQKNGRKQTSRCPLRILVWGAWLVF